MKGRGTPLVSGVHQSLLRLHQHTEDVQVTTPRGDVRQGHALLSTRVHEINALSYLQDFGEACPMAIADGRH